MVGIFVATAASIRPRHGSLSLNKKSQLTNSQIIQAALSVAAEKGAGKVTLDSVAKAAGVSKGGLIYHFSSKEALSVN